MTFEDWMAHRGLSQSTVNKYAGAIKGALSEWANNAGLTSGPLTSITSRTLFDAVSKEILKLSIFAERNSRGHKMYSNALERYSEFLSEGFADDIDADIERIFAGANLTETEKQRLVQARIGQGPFRQKLIAYWGGCAATGFKDTTLLLASHIKPWKSSTNYERLAPFNGLLLLPNIDKAFDVGLITFSVAGQLRVSPQLKQADALGIHDGLSIKLARGHAPYMAFHRDVVFRD